MKHVVGLFKDDTLLYPIFMYPELALADQIIIILIQLGYALSSQGFKYCWRQHRDTDTGLQSQCQFNIGCRVSGLV